MAEHLTRNEKVVGSIPTISSNKEVTTKVVTSLLGSAHFIRSTLRRFQCSGVGKAAPAQFVLRGKTNLRRISAAGQKAGFTAYSSRWASIWWDVIGRQRIFSPIQDSGRAF